METIAALLRIKHVLDGFKVIDPTWLSERERYAYTDTLEHVYGRAVFFLAKGERAWNSNPHLHPSRSCMNWI